jgi:RimJ/RimL family protein N-acetyltransferase
MSYTRGDLLKKLETPRLILRHHQKEDFEQYRETEQSSAKDLSPWFGWINQTRGYNTDEDVRQYFSYMDALNSADKPKQLHFFIFEKSSGKYIGSVIFFRIDWDIPYFYFSYWLASRESGNGYMTEAVNALTRLCFEVYDAKRVQISASIKNPKSLNVPRRLNFTLEGELKNYAMHLATKEVTNALMYACYSPTKLPELECSWALREVTK